MAHAEKRLVWTVAVALLSSGSGLALAADGPAPADTEADVVFSSSVGTVRPLTLTGSLPARVKISGNGRRILIAKGRLLWSGHELWDGETGRLLLDDRKTAPDHCMPNTASIHQILTVDMDERGRWFVTGGTLNFGYSPDLMRSSLVWRGSLVDAWDARSGRLVRTLVMDNRQHMSCSAISRNGARVACVDSSLNVKVWDRETGREIVSVAGALPPNSELADRGWFSGLFNDDLTRFAVRARRKNDVHDRTSIYLCDLPSNRIRLIDPAKDEKTWYRKLAIRGDGREVIAYRDATSGDDELVIFDFETGAVRSRLRQPPMDKGVSFLSYGPGGRTVVLGFVDGHLNLVDLQNGARVELRASDGPVNAAAYLADRGLVRVVAERRWIPRTAHSEAHYAGPMRIADFAVRFPSPSP